VTGVALVTGAAGLVGSRLAERFLREGLSVRALDRHSFDLAGVECIVADVTDPGDMQRATAGAAVVVPWRGRFIGVKAERELGYVPRVSYEEAMAETEHYLAQVGMIKR
jgi:nucleoside-diphosphate-sugar epimerase